MPTSRFLNAGEVGLVSLVNVNAFAGDRDNVAWRLANTGTGRRSLCLVSRGGCSDLVICSDTPACNDGRL